MEYESNYDVELASEDELESDTYSLFITELGHKEALTQVDLLGDEDSPDEARYIQYYV